MDADSLHRLAKALLDSGEVATVDEAFASFSRYGVRIVIDDSCVDNAAAQLIALTAINTAVRSFLGNVIVSAPANMKLRLRGFEGQILADFLDWLGVLPANTTTDADWPTIAIGIHDGGTLAGIKPWANGWRFGLGDHLSGDAEFFAPACVAAGGLAVSEAFSILRGDNPYAGRRRLVLSLWSCMPIFPPEPAVDNIPPMQSTWIVGLGHLGQAYAWTLGFMNIASDATIHLQDVDTVTKSTLSTSMLSLPTDLRRQKTRVVSAWLEGRGVNTAIVERRFTDSQRIVANEPRVALFGVDNAAARRVMESAGFHFIVDAGLGAGYHDFRALRVRTFPGPSEAARLWAEDVPAVDTTRAAAYQDLIAKGADPCGVTTLATRAVGAPFVGCVAAGYALAELARRALGENACGYIDVNLRNPQAIDAYGIAA
jgi:hypothetical protein